MRNYPFSFFFGFVIGFVGLLLFFIDSGHIVEASNVETTPSPTSTIEPLSTLTPGFLLPSPTPIPTPKPTVKPTATPTVNLNPTPTPDVWSPASMEPVFSRFAGQYGVDKNELERLANCESHFNPNAKNGPYLGMFQFEVNTWITSRQAIGRDVNLDLRSNIDESIQTAAYLMSKRGSEPWPNCLR